MLENCLKLLKMAWQDLAIGKACHVMARQFGIAWLFVLEMGI
jgi:hypothetical protein